MLTYIYIPTSVQPLIALLNDGDYVSNKSNGNIETETRERNGSCDVPEEKKEIPQYYNAVTKCFIAASYLLESCDILTCRLYGGWKTSSSSSGILLF